MRSKLVESLVETERCACPGGNCPQHPGKPGQCPNPGTIDNTAGSRTDITRKTFLCPACNKYQYGSTKSLYQRTRT